MGKEQIQKRPRKIVNQDITRDEFMNILKKVCRPIEPIVSDLTHLQTSQSGQPDGYNEMNTH
jgi:hypothetical protein